MSPDFAASREKIPPPNYDFRTLLVKPVIMPGITLWYLGRFYGIVGKNTTEVCPNAKASPQTSVKQYHFQVML